LKISRYIFPSNSQKFSSCDTFLDQTLFSLTPSPSPLFTSPSSEAEKREKELSSYTPHLLWVLSIQNA
jgi:hypothetical protein